MTKEKSTLEWLESQIDLDVSKSTILSLIQQAKALELEQRKKDYRAGWYDNKHKSWNCEFYLEKHLKNFETSKEQTIVTTYRDGTIEVETFNSDEPIY